MTGRYCLRLELRHGRNVTPPSTLIDRFGLQDCIWRGMYYTPGGAKAGGYGHYDHVHITTRGGGYPTGDEVYIR